jgi:hypothetical protein
VTKTCKNTQSEITAGRSAPELSGTFLRGVSSSFSNEHEGRVTAVVAKEGIKKQPRINPSRDSNTLLGVAPVMQSSRFY